MGALDVAGVIGTWVAAIIAIVALVGIIGPILIWRASRTERHRALAAVSNDNNYDFISCGIHAGPGIWLLQRVKVPLLHTAPVTIDGSFVLNVDAVKESTSPATWVNLGNLIRAYGIVYARGDNLKIYQARTFLPVHKLWLLAIGLAGRYGERKDKGKFRSESRVVRTTTPRGARDSRLAFLPARESMRLGRDRGQSITPQLFGVTGSLAMISMRDETSHSCLEFTPASRSDIGQMLPETLSPKVIFMLASGFMPMAGDRFFSLAESSFESDDLSSSESEPVDVEREYSKYRSKPAHNDDFEYVPRHRIIEAYQLFPASEPDSNLSSMARQFKAENADVLVLGVVRRSTSLSSELQQYDGMTYVPADSSWIRVSSTDIARQAYIARADAQEMAHSLLDLKWHPESYMLGTFARSIGMHLLTRTASRFGRIAHRVRAGISKIGIGAREQTRLWGALEPALRKIEKGVGPPDRTTAAIFYKLDRILEELGQHGDRLIIDRMVGILMITNEEFQELFYQSLRHLQQATNSTIEVDTRAATISIPSAFGVLQTFTLDLDKVYPDQERGHDPLSVPYSAIVIAALKSCTRSQMLQDCFDAGPLIEFVQDCSDLVLVQ